VLTAALVAAAAIAGVTGTWSPCGFSMIETLCADRRRLVFSCTAFALGGVAGGAATFGVLAGAGAAVHALGGGAVAVTAPVLALAAAVTELRGAAIAPQIRRQVPERWRRVLPLPLAAALYGVLLGLGFTTFVLTFAVWALAGVTFALGRVELGLVVGIAFGLGRAVPVVALAPIAHRRIGIRLVNAMAQRPALLRAMRLADAAALLLAAATIFVAQASAATSLGSGTDPSAAGDVVVWTAPSGGVERHGGDSTTASVPPHAAVGGSLIAWRDGDQVHVAQAADLTPVLELSFPGVDALAVSDDWLVTRSRGTDRRDTLAATAIASPDQTTTLAVSAPPEQLGRPALDGNLLVYHVATRHDSRIVEEDLATSSSHVVRRSRSALLTNPALLSGDLLYVRQTDLAQLLELGPVGRTGRDHVLYRLAAPAPHDLGHDPGYSRKTRTPHPRASRSTLWTTALSASLAYVTLLPRSGSPSGARIVAVPR
jgi:hypothetical protein